MSQPTAFMSFFFNLQSLEFLWPYSTLVYNQNWFRL